LRFLARYFSCARELASRQIPNLEDQDLFKVFSLRQVAFTMAKDVLKFKNKFGSLGVNVAIKVEMSFNDIEFNFNYMTVVTYGTSAERCVQ
jgi:hypothetical protein